MKANEFKSLVLRYIKGDKEAFTKIFEEYYHKLVGAAFLILHDKEESQNVADDVFVKILSEPQKYLNLKNPSSYLFVVTQNISKNLLRQHKYNMPEPIQERDEIEQVIARLDFYDLLEKHFNQKEQEILILRCVWDCTYKEIAQRLNYPIATIKSKFQSFRRRLKKKF